MSVAPKSAASARSGASRKSNSRSLSRQKIPIARSKGDQSPPIEALPLRGSRQRSPNLMEPELPSSVVNMRAVTRPKASTAKTRQKQANHRPQARGLAPSQSTPAWLAQLTTWQRISSAIAFLLVSATLTVYGGTVYTQQLWSREYKRLENLQRQERQLTAADEVLKNQLANQAEQPNNGLVSPDPHSTLFLESAPSPLASPSATPNPKPAPSPKLTPTPMGY